MGEFSPYLNSGEAIYKALTSVPESELSASSRESLIKLLNKTIDQIVIGNVGYFKTAEPKDCFRKIADATRNLRDKNIYAHLVLIFQETNPIPGTQEPLFE